VRAHLITSEASSLPSLPPLFLSIKRLASPSDSPFSIQPFSIQPFSIQPFSIQQYHTKLVTTWCLRYIQDHPSEARGSRGAPGPKNPHQCYRSTCTKGGTSPGITRNIRPMER